MKFLLFVILCFGIFHSHAQLEKLEANKQAVDTLFFSNAEKALKISEASIPMAISLNDTMMITYFLDQAGELNRKQGNYDIAIEQLESCLKYKQNWKDLRDLSITNNNLGRAWINKGEYDKGANYFIICLELMEKAGNVQGEAYFSNNLGVVFDLSHNYTKALKYYTISLKAKKTLKDSAGIMSTYNNLGIVYFNLDDIAQSIKFHKQSLYLARSLNKTENMAKSMSSLGFISIKTGALTTAHNYLIQAIDLYTKSNNLEGLCLAQNNMSLYFQAKSNIDSAVFYNNLSIKNALEIKSLKTLRDAYLLRSELLESQGELSSSLSSVRLAMGYKDSLLDEENINSVTEMEARYEYEKNQRLLLEQEAKISSRNEAISRKEAKIKTQNLKLAYAAGTVIILASIVFLFIVLFKNSKKRARLLDAQNILIEKQNSKLQLINERLNSELDKTKMSLSEKEELLKAVYNQKPDDLPDEIVSLSKREKEVLAHLALGWSDQEIADKLFISKTTAKTHLRRIYSKLLVRGRAEAVAIAHKHGIIG